MSCVDHTHVYVNDPLQWKCTNQSYYKLVTDRQIPRSTRHEGLALARPIMLKMYIDYNYHDYYYIFFYYA